MCVMTRTYRIALTPGDGIGTEALESALGVPAATQVRTGDLGTTSTTAEFTHEALARVGAHSSALTAVA